MEEVHRARNGEGTEPLCSEYHSPQLPTCSNQKLAEPSALGVYGDFITQARLREPLAMGY